jgi:hypothetical protein
MRFAEPDNQDSGWRDQKSPTASFADRPRLAHLKDFSCKSIACRAKLALTGQKSPRAVQPMPAP